MNKANWPGCSGCLGGRQLGGHKSLYSEAYYDREVFDRLYDGANLARVRQDYDPDGRLTGLYEKAVGRQ